MKPLKEPVVTNQQPGTRRVEGRDQQQRIPHGKAKVWTQSQRALPANLARVNEVARQQSKTQFTALLHHVDEAALVRAFQRLRRNAAAGVDGETVASYEQGLGENLKNLLKQVHTGRYRPLPVRRVYIPKLDGGKRPLGVPALEDKLLQSAVAEVLGAIYEADFLGFSYGFRPGRNPHQALYALHNALMGQKVNWVLDADIRSFFDSVDHEWLMRMIKHRITDKRIVRLIGKWLKSGVLEDGVWRETEQGTPQGAGISPLLSNIFLHYAFDLWVHQWRQRNAHGRVIVVRYADDFVMGFQDEADAMRMVKDLKERLGKFKLALHEEKTRLIQFGKFASERREKRGLGRPETFHFLGFTHYCGKTREGRFIVKCKTQSKRLIHKLKALRVEARRRMHMSVTRQHAWLSRVLTGHYQYYGLPCNGRSLGTFCHEVRQIWRRVLSRRSQRSVLSWDRFAELEERFPLPQPHITHPWSTAIA
jgi:group II intron reverse transcriptase/maturase